MDYERYSKMNSEQKDEYHFRFDKYNNFEMPIDIKWIIIFWFSFSFFIFTSWIMFKIPPTGYENKGQYFFNYGIKFLGFITYLILIEIIMYFIIIIYGFIKKYKWLKQRGI